MKSIQRNKFNQSKIRLLAVVVSLLLVVGMIGTLSGCSLFRRRPSLDSERGAIVLDRVTNAQYIPDIENLIDVNSLQAQALEFVEQSSNFVSFREENQNDSQEVYVAAMDLEDFVNLQENLARIEVVGAGTDYDIFKIRDEIQFVLNTVPAFNQWFIMPTMRADQGFVAIPYYEGWSYYIDASDDMREITITRISWFTRFSVWDFENNRSYESNRRRGTYQFQVMQTRYYFDNLGREVVEALVLNVGVIYGVHHPLNIQFLRNVENTSFSKFYVTLAERISGRRSIPCPLEGRYYDGWDVRGIHPTGIRLDFTQLDYTDDGEIQLLRIMQTRPVANHLDKPVTTGILFYNQSGDVVQFYAASHDYFDEATHFEGFFQRPHNGIVNVSSIFNTSLRGRQNWWRYVADVVVSENVTRTNKFYQTAGNEQGMMSAIYASVESLGRNLGVQATDITQFNSQIAPYRNTIYSQQNNAMRILDGFIEKVAASTIGNFELINNWDSIYAASRNPREASMTGPFVGQDLPISYLMGDADLHDGILSINGDAEVLSQRILQSAGTPVMHPMPGNFDNFTLGVSLRSDSGQHTILIASFISNRWGNTNREHITTGGISADGGSVLPSTFNFYELPVLAAGTYTLVWVVIERLPSGENAVMFDTLVPVSVRGAPMRLYDSNATMTLRSRVMTLTVV